MKTQEESLATPKQHTSPCSDCPWRKNSINGWLGSLDPKEWVEAAHGDGLIDCHTLKKEGVYPLEICNTNGYNTL